jgi:ABC-type multidrug transport system fused ATPase/permease subunit
VTKGEVCFENVSFSYNDWKFTLKRIDFTVKGGLIVAIVSKIRGSKSTVLGLIERFYNIRTSRITINN